MDIQDNSVKIEEIAEPQINEPVIDENVSQEVVEPGNTHVQSAEDNAKYAAARREAENKAKMLEDNQNETARSLGYEDWNEFQEAVKADKARKEAEAKQQRVEQFGYDPEEYINKAVEEKLKNDPRIKKVEEAEQKARITSTINELNNAFNLSLKTGQDLDNLPNADKIAKLVTAGFDIKEAYSMANPDVEKKVAAVKQAALSSVSGRQHLSQVSGTPTSETVTVPNDVYQVYANKGWSDERIQNLYKQLQKNTR